jgi:hypothetical protein
MIVARVTLLPKGHVLVVIVVEESISVVVGGLQEESLGKVSKTSGESGNRHTWRHCRKVSVEMSYWR